MSEQVTKTKNEGRVNAGKRLAEWNRKQKENLLKNREHVASSDSPSGDSDQQEPQSQTSTVVYGSGALAVIVVVGVVALYLYRGKTSDSTPSKAAPPKALSNNDDIFCKK